MRIRGLTHTPGFVTASEGQALLDAIDGEPWRPQELRRVQHYGYAHDNGAKRIDGSMCLGELPPWSTTVVERLRAHTRANQLTVDEYRPGQGSRSHVENIPCYGDVIATITLGSTCVVTLDRTGRRDRYDHPLTPGSLVLLDGAARFFWRHGIRARKLDVIDGRTVRRTRLVTLTFRRVLERRVMAA
jgi:alkylated DNA repair dioxygenase AlkB